MSEIKILVDSASDINAEEAKKLGVELLPIEVRFSKDESYFDGVDILPKQFFEKLIESADLPKTSQINEFTFDEKFNQLVESGYDVVAITISSKLSGTYRSAVAAAKNYKGKVFVVDSLNASIGERLLCLQALKLAKEGMSAREIAAQLDKLKTRINLLALLDTLLYLKKGGRISAMTAFAGQVLSIKPVIGVINGEVKLVGKAMGSKKGNNLLNTLAKEKGIDFNLPYGVIYSGTDDTMLKKYVADSEHLWKDKTECIPAYMIGCTIGTHIGPNAVGVAFFEVEND